MTKTFFCLKAALIQVSDYRLLGDSGFYFELIVPRASGSMLTDFVSATAGHNFGRGPSNDYSIKGWF
jgi:hypothetical protein